jgi:dTDP-4-dehydrorhamnose reductase
VFCHNIAIESKTLLHLRILVTGANGQLGSEFKEQALVDSKANFAFVDIEEMDLGSDKAIETYFQGKHFDFVINCAAYTAVDKAEQDQALAQRINSDAVRAIAMQCKEKSMRLIHISTDYVFDGKGNQPIKEDANTNPLSIYGKTKLAGEHSVLSVLDNAYILRTAWVYSTFGKNFVKTISKLASERESLNVVSDQIGSPTYARDLAQAIRSIISSISAGTDVPGTYHFSNEGAISWYDFAWFIVNYYKFPCRVNAIPSEAYPTPAIRPRFSVLDKTKLKNTFDIQVPHWYDSLRDCLQRLKP